MLTTVMDITSYQESIAAILRFTTSRQATHAANVVTPCASAALQPSEKTGPPGRRGGEWNRSCFQQLGQLSAHHLALDTRARRAGIDERVQHAR